MIATAPPSTDQAAPVTVLARALQRKTIDVGDLARLGEAAERDLVALGLQGLLAARPARGARLVGQAALCRSTAATPPARASRR